MIGLALQQSTGQAAQIVGFAAGSTFAGIDPRTALMVNSVTFGISALLIRLGVHDRRPVGISRPAGRCSERATASGSSGIPGSCAESRFWFSPPCSSGWYPEGLAAGWAQTLADGTARRGRLDAGHDHDRQSGRDHPRWTRRRPAAQRRTTSALDPVFAVLTPLALVPRCSAYLVSLMAFACGFMGAGMFPAANGLFVEVLPAGYRARAFGVMQTGVQVSQGAAVLATGVMAERFSLPVVVGAWSIGGVLLTLAVAFRWPSNTEISQEIEENRRANASPPGPEAPPPQTSRVEIHEGCRAWLNRPGSNPARRSPGRSTSPPAPSAGRPRTTSASSRSSCPNPAPARSWSATRSCRSTRTCAGG